MTDPGTFKLFFGKYEGQTFDEVFMQNPLYLDWLIGQPWLNSTTYRLLARFLSLPDVEATLVELLKEPEYSFTITYDTPLQRARQGMTDSWRFTYYDWTPHQKPFKDDCPRPARFITAGCSDSLSELRRQGYTAEQEQAATEPRQQIDSWREAWQYAADLLNQIEQAEELSPEAVPLAYAPQAKQLPDFLPARVVLQIRQAWKDRTRLLKDGALASLIPAEKLDQARAALEALEQQPSLWSILYLVDSELCLQALELLCG